MGMTIAEKILAAKRAGLKEVVLCKENRKHVEEIEPEYIKGLEFHYVDRMDEVLAIALVPKTMVTSSNGVHKKGKKVQA